MNETEPAIIHAARLLTERLERLSADSYWAHKASGLRGSLLRSLEDWELQRTGQYEPDGVLLRRLDQLTRLGFEILNRAAREILPPRSK